MLKVRKSSWHYKLAYNNLTSHIFDQKEPTDLCTYMRQVLKPAFWSVTLLLAICGAVFDIYMLSLFGGEGWVWPEVSTFAFIILYLISALGWGLMLMSGLGVTVAILIIVCYFLQEVLWKSVKVRWEENREDKEPEPNLLWEWFKAQKQRVCPLIEVVED